MNHKIIKQDRRRKQKGSLGYIDQILLNEQKDKLIKREYKKQKTPSLPQILLRCIFPSNLLNLLIRKGQP